MHSLYSKKVIYRRMEVIFECLSHPDPLFKYQQMKSASYIGFSYGARAVHYPETLHVLLSTLNRNMIKQISILILTLIWIRLINFNQTRVKTVIRI